MKQLRMEPEAALLAGVASGAVASMFGASNLVAGFVGIGAVVACLAATVVSVIRRTRRPGHVTERVAGSRRATALLIAIALLAAYLLSANSHAEAGWLLACSVVLLGFWFWPNIFLDR